MKKKIIALFFSMAMIVAFGTAGIANPITLQDGVGSVNAGIFKVLINGVYSFDTFCLERSETVNYNTPYNYTINTYAIAGGGGSVGGQDDISAATAYLYTQFRAGAYDKTDADAMSALQVAFWILEDEYDPSNSTTFETYETKAQEYITLAAGASGIGNVRVMNLYITNATTGAIENKQSMLMLVPEPVTLLLLGLGLLGIGVVKRKKN